jgi:hypothetical protein
MPTVHRIHIRPSGGLGDPRKSFAFCLNEKVLGLGWQAKNQKSGISWEEYEKDAEGIHGKSAISRVRYLKERVFPDDLLWTRDLDGNYYLGNVLSGWEYSATKEAQDADITNVVRCKILKVLAVDDVPGKVIACFRPQRAIQSIQEPTAKNYSLQLWNKLSGTTHYKIDQEGSYNIFTFLDAEQTEDVIYIYLQTLGWIVIPNSRKADTMRYECYLIRKSDKRRAILQVKTGSTPLDISEWKGEAESVILFQANNVYKNQCKEKNVDCLDPEVIEDFIYMNLDLMPSSIAHWATVAHRQAKVGLK